MWQCHHTIDKKKKLRETCNTRCNRVKTLLFAEGRVSFDWCLACPEKTIAELPMGLLRSLCFTKTYQSPSVLFIAQKYSANVPPYEIRLFVIYFILL
jgi:hypothetical protein